MKVLVIAPYWPWPLDSGGSVAQFGSMDYLRFRHEVTLLIPAYTAEHLRAANQLRRLWPQVTVLPLRPPPATRIPTIREKIGDRLKDFVKGIYRAVKPRRDAPPPLESQRMVGLPRHIVSAAAAEARRGYDLIQVEYVEMLSLVHVLPDNVPKLFLQHEIHYLVRDRARDAASRADDWANYILGQEKARELDTLRRYDAIMTLSEHDRQVLQAELPESDIYASPFAYVNPPGQEAGFKVSAFGDKIVYIGGCNHLPNVDAVEWFLETMWPALSARNPKLRFLVVGEWSLKSRQQLGAIPGVEFTGFVEDVAAVLRGAIMVVPLRVGSGIRAKILMAMTLGTPVVTTSVGVEGIETTNGVEMSREDSPERFVEAVARLAENPLIAARMAERAFALMQKQWSPEATGARRDEIYRMIQAKHVGRDHDTSSNATLTRDESAPAVSAQR